LNLKYSQLTKQNYAGPREFWKTQTQTQTFRFSQKNKVVQGLESSHQHCGEEKNAKEVWKKMFYAPYQIEQTRKAQVPCM
jgi:hypothetical protein